MQKLENHIETLLQKHDFVIIPAFGGFVASENSAQMENGYLLPPSKTIGFNPDLTYNDGLLAQDIAKSEDISLIEANNLIAEKVEKLNTTLRTFKHLSFASIGTFHLNGEKVSFEPNRTNDLLKSSYGLQAFYFPEISSNTISLTEKVKSEPKETKVTRSFNYVAACVAAIILLLLIPVNFNQKQVVYRATFVPITALEEVVIKPQVEEEEEVICTPFHAVIGSFNTQAKALKFLSELPKGLKDSKIVYSDHRFRIIADSYETEDLGNIGIQNIAKKYPQFRDVWLLNYNP